MISGEQPSVPVFLVSTEKARQLVGGKLVWDYLRARGLKPSFVGGGRGGAAHFYRPETIKAALDVAELNAKGKPIDLGEGES